MNLEIPPGNQRQLLLESSSTVYPDEIIRQAEGSVEQVPFASVLIGFKKLRG
jgi:hypothetical protein